MIVTKSEKVEVTTVLVLDRQELRHLINMLVRCELAVHERELRTFKSYLLDKLEEANRVK